MAALYFPHAVTVETASEPLVKADGSVLPPTFAAPVARQVQITPKSFMTTFHATGLELKRPHKLLDYNDGAVLYVVGSKVTYGSRQFKVELAPRIHDIGNDADHVSVWLEELQFATS